ncbi:DNA-binding protein [Candidatus Saccharibacteria bacterium QS_5_54_17]|nr:MAG: DNA-binding protein [Candidatus Saccharibacteria bacterium QS_5_54_17]
MKYHNSKSDFVLVLHKNETLIAMIADFCKEHNITAGFFHGLGGALSAELGYYHLDKQEYEFQTFEGVMEIASLHGNVALKDGEPFIHAHAVLSDAGLRTYAGHVKELTVGGTCEVHLRTFTDEWHREYDQETGLSLIDFPS